MAIKKTRPKQTKPPKIKASIQQLDVDQMGMLMITATKLGGGRSNVRIVTSGTGQIGDYLTALADAMRKNPAFDFS